MWATAATFKEETRPPALVWGQGGAVILNAKRGLVWSLRANAGRAADPPPSGETKAGSWAVWADPALVPDAATLLVGWAHQQSLAGVPKRVRF